MISGAHAIIYSKDADADRRFLRDVLKFPHVDAGHGWLIFALPPAEVAVHPADEEGGHELYLMCDDIAGLTRKLTAQGVECSGLHEQRWGVLAQVSLPSGGKLGIYEPRHARPPQSASTRPKSARRKVAKRKATQGKTAARRKSAPRRSRNLSARRRRSRAS
jgi:hypothetical protein